MRYRAAKPVRTKSQVWVSIIADVSTGELMPTGLTHKTKSAAHCYSSEMAFDWSERYPVANLVSGVTDAVS